VVHRGTARSLRAGRIYLTYTLAGGVLLLAAIVWLAVLAGSQDFVPGGYLAVLEAGHEAQLKLIFACWWRASV
jgi:multicomponent Na+:H+ antiporter subunit D